MSVSRRKFNCSVGTCTEPPYLGGLCKEHSDDRALKERRRDAALNALHMGEVEGRLPDDPELREELLRLQTWWGRACDSVNHERENELLKDEAPYAIEWCISLAAEIVVAEIAIRQRNDVPYTLQATRYWVWERFSNLEKGLMSNGVERTL